MPGSTSKGVPYPVGSDAAASLDTITQSLAQWVSDNPGVASLTTAQINALSGAALWVGRVVLNNQTLKPMIYLGSWVQIALNSEVVAAAAQPDPRCGGHWQRSASGQLFPSAATTKFAWDIEIGDSDGFWVPAGDITIPAGKGGVYAVSCVIFNSSVSCANSNFGAVLTVGGVGIPFSAPTPQFLPTCFASVTLGLSAGQTVTVAITNAGVALTANAFIWVYRVSS